MRVFTKINGKLAVWDCDGTDYDSAIRAVRDELGREHRNAVLALVKYCLNCADLLLYNYYSDLASTDRSLYRGDFALF